MNEEQLRCEVAADTAKSAIDELVEEAAGWRRRAIKMSLTVRAMREAIQEDRPGKAKALADDALIVSECWR